MPRLDFYYELKPFLSIRLEGRRQLVGRAPECDVQIPSADVSRHHARFRAVDGGYEIEDLSRNGTRVNHAWVRGARRLDPGDRVYLGSRVIVFQPDDAPVADLEGEVTVEGP